ncbi:hypothetical protein QBC41DRAFT_300496 [Cercophora samala]|uniref:Uncharacterized protein n=1 Tax=Cercophora samala TaxID=330535 RepID=A0AA39ZII7_9PEZI|nr:hypothetical protein QBC41DRAFT_300496 [Cercophora samala]
MSPDSPHQYAMHAPATFDTNTFNFGWWPSVRHPDSARMKRRMAKHALVASLAPSHEYQRDFWQSWASYFADAADQSFEHWKRSMESYTTTIQTLHETIQVQNDSIKALQEKDQQSQEYIRDLERRLNAPDNHTPTAQITSESAKTEASVEQPDAYISIDSDDSSTDCSSVQSSNADRSRSTSTASSVISNPTSPDSPSIASSSIASSSLNSSNTQSTSLPTKSQVTKVEDLLEKLYLQGSFLRQQAKDALSTCEARLKLQTTKTSYRISALQGEVAKQTELYLNLRKIVRAKEKRELKQTLLVRELKQTVRAYEEKEDRHNELLEGMKESARALEKKAVERGEYIKSLEQRVGQLHLRAQPAEDFSIVCSDTKTSVTIEPTHGDVVVVPNMAVANFLGALGVSDVGLGH